MAGAVRRPEFYRQIISVVPKLINLTGTIRHSGGSRARSQAFQRHPEGLGTKPDTGSRFKPGTGFAGMTFKDSFK
jgi:hypothetical protein